MTNESSVSLPIQAKVQPRQLFWNILYAVLCGGLGVWGAWDYFVTIPQAEANFARFAVAQKTMEDLAAVAETRMLQPQETEAFLEAETVTKAFSEPPVPPAAYDRAVQLWLYIVGCGVLGTPFFVWNLIVMPRAASKWRLAEDGSLDTPEGSIPSEQISNLDMSRWMAKSIATVETTDGRAIKLDDYKFRHMDLIIGALAQRFAPGEWTAEAKPIPKPEVVADAPLRDEDGEVVASDSDASK